MLGQSSRIIMVRLDDEDLHCTFRESETGEVLLSDRTGQRPGTAALWMPNCWVR
jgi:hypothetical protein